MDKKVFKLSYKKDTWAGSFDDAKKQTNFEETLPFEAESKQICTLKQ